MGTDTKRWLGMQEKRVLMLALLDAALVLAVIAQVAEPTWCGLEQRWKALTPEQKESFVNPRGPGLNRTQLELLCHLAGTTFEDGEGG